MEGEHAYEQRRYLFAEFLMRARLKCLKLLLLVRWAASHAHTVAKCQTLLAFLTQQAAVVKESADRLYWNHTQLNTERVSAYDIDLAISVLVTGTYDHLPKSIGPAARRSVAALEGGALSTATDVTAALDRISAAVRRRIYSQHLPGPMARNLSIVNGIAFIEVADEFRVRLIASSQAS